MMLAIKLNKRTVISLVAAGTHLQNCLVSFFNFQGSVFPDFDRALAHATIGRTNEVECVIAGRLVTRDHSSGKAAGGVEANDVAVDPLDDELPGTGDLPGEVAGGPVTAGGAEH